MRNGRCWSSWPDPQQLVVQAEVQDGVHHAGHGLTCAGTDGDQQRVLVVAEGLAGDLLEALDVLEDVSGDLVVDLTAVCVILGAGLGGDGEACGTGIPAAVISARPAPLPPRMFFMVTLSPPKASLPSLK